MNIKLSYPVCVPMPVEKIMAWCEEPEKGIGYLSKIGYKGIELLVKNPDDIEKEKLREILEKNKMKVSAIGTTPMQKEDHLFLLSEEKEIRDEAVKRLKSLIKLGGWFEAPVLIGKYRGTVKDADFCRLKDLEAIIRNADKMAREEQTELFIEPQNPDNINNLNTIGETVSWIRENQFTNVRLLMDIFHMDKTEESIADILKKYQEYIGMIHMADSERKVPGFGKIDMKGVLDALKQIVYQGYLSMEIRQNPDSRFAATLAAMSLQYMDGER